MKTKKQDISIRKLFRQKLEYAEIIPDASINSILMRKLARREFLRFNPARFNIYYLGLILVAGITTAIILFQGTGNSDELTSLKLSGEKKTTDNTEYINAPVDTTIIQKSNRLSEIVSESIKNMPITRTKINSGKEPEQITESRQNNYVVHTVDNKSISKIDLFPDGSPDRNKLQGEFKPDEILFETSATDGCTPLRLSFYNKSNSFDSCRWTFGDGGYSNEKNPEWLFDVGGKYNVVLKVFGSDGRFATSSAVITVFPKPLACFEISPEKAVLPEDEIRFFNYSANAVRFNWDFGDGSNSELFEPRHRYEKSGNYNVRLIASSDNGCSDSITVYNAFTNSEYFIDFPNAFIPNSQGPTGGNYSSKSDEAAEVFHPVFSGVSDYQLKIYHKIGMLIFESSDVNIGWDGYFKGQLSEPGVYIWQARGNFRNGEPFIKMGDVTLLKN